MCPRIINGGFLINTDHVALPRSRKTAHESTGAAAEAAGARDGVGGLTPKRWLDVHGNSNREPGTMDSKA